MSARENEQVNKKVSRTIPSVRNHAGVLFSVLCAEKVTIF